MTNRNEKRNNCSLFKEYFLQQEGLFLFLKKIKKINTSFRSVFSKHFVMCIAELLTS